MMGTRILILGGYGNTGLKIADLLLNRTDTQITLAARNRKKLEATSRQLNEKKPDNPVSWTYADASDRDSLQRAFEGVHMVVVASSTAEYVDIVVSSALKAGIDYLDLQYSSKKVKILKSVETEIVKAGRCFITDGGFHPGLPAALVRYGAQYFDRLNKAIVGSLIRQDWGGMDVSPPTAIEFVREIVDFQATFYRGGEWKAASMFSTKDFVKMEFRKPFGTQLCAPMFLEEMRELPETYPSLRRTGFYIAGFNKFVDMLVFPFIMVTLKLLPQLGLKPMARLMYWSLGAFSNPPYATLLKLEASGEKDGQPKEFEVQLQHEDGYWFTAIPVVACLLQYLDGSIRKAGLWCMGNLVEPNRLIRDMEQLGITITMSKDAKDGLFGKDAIFN